MPSKRIQILKLNKFNYLLLKTQILKSKKKTLLMKMIKSITVAKNILQLLKNSFKISKRKL